MVEVLWKFANDQKRHRLKCWVLPGCTKDFVLGSKFLHMTKTLTAFSHRIKKVFTSLKLRLRLMSEEKLRLSGIFNNRMTSALADTGSDLMLVSLEYALHQGLSVNTGKKYRSEVELADGTKTWTHGTVENAMWTVGESTVQCDFHVLDGLPADIILSKDYLFDLNIFSDYADSFFDLDSVEDLTLLCGIRLVEEEIQDLEKLEEEFLRDVTSQDAFNFDAGKKERRRRLLTVKKIASLPLAERPEALSHEEDRKRSWNMARAQHKRLWTRTS
ncbi:hypothetical protein CGCF415_v009425 [Colletotrichum fructicola]|nr:hypothetical protein CGCF415_v009425 [Colletotrichum fructicola]KAF4942726.1 hypothetical protein CGCF245_v000282 [Colletotrichum fructicola]